MLIIVLNLYFFSAGRSKYLRRCLFAAISAVLLYVLFEYDFLFSSTAWKRTLRAQETILQAFEIINIPTIRPLSSCSDLVCSSFLPAWDMESYKSCTQRVRELYGNTPIDTCKFRNSTGKRSIALVSLPGSGNTWTRGLLQKLTGVCTGSVVCDTSLRHEGFAGEEVHSAAVLVVKSHDTSLQWSSSHNSQHKQVNPQFEGAIFLIRNPFHSIVSEWNRKLTKKHLGEGDNSHIKFAGKDAFGTNPGWSRSIISLIWRWRLMIINYLIEPQHHPILVIYYEDLKRNVMKEMKRMLNFLEIPYSTNNMQKIIMSGFDQFHRNHSDEFEHYTADQKQLINGVISWVINSVKEKVQVEKEVHIAHFKSYLQ